MTIDPNTGLAYRYVPLSAPSISFADFLPKSDAEIEVDRLQQAVSEPGNPIGTPIASALKSPLAYVGDKLSDLWASAELAITPESQGEALVNQIYGRDEQGNALTPPNITPAYQVADLALPAIFVKARDTVTHAVDSIGTKLTQYGVIAVAILLGVLFVYAFIGAKARNLAR